MFGLKKNAKYLKTAVLPGATKYGPIGLELEDDMLKLVQLQNNGKGIRLIAGGSDKRPENVKPATGNWQRWAIETLTKLTADGEFKGKQIIAAIPPTDMFIEQMKMPKANEGYLKSKKSSHGQNDRLQQAVISKIKHKLPFKPETAMVKYVPTEEGNLLVMAADRHKIDRYLAIYENADLRIKAIGVWPTALVNTYTSFFGRRKTDTQTVVMLVEIEPNCTKVVVCRHQNLLCARLIPTGAKNLQAAIKNKAEQTIKQAAQDNKTPSTSQDGETITRLVLELNTCRRNFVSMHKKAHIKRLIFLSGQVVDKSICETIAKQLEMPAQIADCLAAVEITNPDHVGIDRRGCPENWATAFGLSLS